MTQLRLRDWRVIAFGLALLILWFGLLDLRALYFPDEGRYAEIPREMLASGDWVTPRIDGFAYFEKPPLQYWLTAALFAVFGPNEWTARLPAALAGFGGVVAIFLTATHLYGRRAACMAAAVLGSGCGYFLATQFVTLDMMLTALLTGALCAFLLAQDARATAAQNRNWMLVAWALSALAVLTKGLIGLVLPAGADPAYVLLARDWSLLRRLHLIAGVLVVLAITAPWFVLAEVRNPGFADFFFVREHWQRFTQPGHQRTGAWWYFVPIGAVFLMPWLPAIVRSAFDGKTVPHADATSGFDPARFAWCWAAVIFVFFSLSSSKLPAYIMPAMGGLALAAAAPLARHWSRTIRITAAMLMVSGVFAATVAIPAADWIKVPMVESAYRASVGWILAGAAVFLVTGVVAWRWAERRPLASLAGIVLGGMLACQLGAIVAHRVDGYFSAQGLLSTVTQGARPFRPDVPFYSVDIFDHTVPFYLGRTVILVKEQSELAWGIAAAPQNYIPDVAQFEQRWRGDADAYAVMAQPTYEWLRDAGLPMRLIASDGRRTVVARR